MNESPQPPSETHMLQAEPRLQPGDALLLRRVRGAEEVGATSGEQP